MFLKQIDKINVSEYFDLRTLLHYLHFIHSPIHLSFIHIYHFDRLSLAVWQDTCHTYKNLVYDLAHHESPIAQSLDRPTGIWKVMGSTPVRGSEKFFFWVFRLENASSLFTLYPSQQSIYHLFKKLVTKKKIKRCN